MGLLQSHDLSREFYILTRVALVNSVYCRFNIFFKKKGCRIICHCHGIQTRCRIS
jgi:hypothetical protein